MIHPLADAIELLKDNEIEERIHSLSRKYFQTHNEVIQHEITVYLDMYKAELATRRAKMWQDQYQRRDTDLDSLININ
jgi:predicted DNA-binding protein